jgi:hypothetical protein
MWTALFLAFAGVARADPLEVGVQDDRMLYNPTARPIFLSDARYLGATRVRMIVTPGDEDIADQAVEAVRAAGMIPEFNLTPGPEDPPFTTEAFKGWVSALASRFAGRVQRWSFINEPNCCGFLIPVGQDCVSNYERIGVIRKKRTRARLPFIVTRRAKVRRGGRWRWIRRYVFVRRHVHGRWQRVRLVRYRWMAAVVIQKDGRTTLVRACTPNDLAREYRGLYEVGYTAVKAVDPGAQVLVGEVAGRNAANDFMRRVASEGDGPVVADGIATHPYNDTVYDGRDLVNDASVVRTPAGGPAPTYFTENGVFARPTTGWTVERITDDETRARKLVSMWDLACHTPGVLRQSQYMFAPMHGLWDTSILDEDWKPDAAFFALRDWLASHPECRR